MKHEQLTGKIIEVFYEVYNELGHGFLESVYEASMRLALTEAGLFVPPKKPLEVWFRGVIVGVFEPDITVENLVILEVKAARGIDPAHEAQVLIICGRPKSRSACCSTSAQSRSSNAWCSIMSESW